MTNPPADPAPNPAPGDPQGPDLLVLGGTSWLGGAVAREAMTEGYRVTCLARGESGEPPSGARWVRGDRTAPGAYEAVTDRDWDAVVDVSWQPDQVRSALAALSGHARHWVYVSSASAYADDATAGTDESAPLHAPHPDPGPVDMGLYGPAKVACERACREAMGPDHVLVARAGLIAGHGDRSDRFGYWPARIAREEDGREGDGRPVLVPPLEAPVQVIDVDDLATWLVRAAQQAIGGVFNAVGDTLPLRSLLEACVSGAGAVPRYVETTDAWLAGHDVSPWSGPESLPLWLPQPEYAGFMTRSNQAARAAGLRLRPVAATAAAALRWEQELGLTRARSAGLTPDREQELVALLAGAADASG